MGFFSRFIAINRGACTWLENRLGISGDTFPENYAGLVSRCLADRPTSIVVDCGGGRKYDFAPALQPSFRGNIIAADISSTELLQNTGADYRVVADAQGHLPIASAAVDFVTSCRLLEHLTDVEVYLRECHRILKPDGLCIIFFPAAMPCSPS